MQKISSEDIVNYKILPFNLYSEFGEKLFTAGEVLTPGKLMQLRQLNVLYKEDNGGNKISQTENVESQEVAPDISALVREVQEANPDIAIPTGKFEQPKEIIQPIKPKNSGITVEEFDMNPDNKVQRARLTVDDVDILS